MSWDFYTPDYYFSTEYLQEKKLEESIGESYLLPMRTFWRPVHFESYVEPDLRHPTHARLERVYPNLTKKDQEAEARNNKLSKGEKKPYHGGVLVSALRPHDIKHVNDHMRFDRYISFGHWKEHHYISDIKDLVKHKTTKGQFDYNEFFKAL